MTPSFKLKGAKEMRRRMAGLAERSADQVKSGLRLEGEYIMTRAKKTTESEGVPVDLGTLRASGFVSDAERHGKNVSVTLAFGGPAGSGNQGETNREDVGYAVVVHEDLTARHTVGSAKYLERPMMEAIPGMSERIAKKIDLSSRRGTER